MYTNSNNYAKLGNNSANCRIWWIYSTYTRTHTYVYVYKWIDR